jgi:hypothetical protein
MPSAISLSLFGRKIFANLWQVEVLVVLSAKDVRDTTAAKGRISQ